MPIVLIVTLVAYIVAVSAHGTAMPLYRDASQPIPVRVSDLLARMSTNEKVVP